MERMTRTNAKKTTNGHSHPPGKDEQRFERNVDHRLRENYIVKKDNHYTKLEVQFDKLVGKPEFTRFISLKKTTTHESALNKFKHQLQRSSSGERLRRRPLYMRLRRPEHNSPMKVRTPELPPRPPKKDTGKDKEKDSVITSEDPSSKQQDNDVILNQLVTQMQRRGKQHTKNPYRKGSLFYVTSALRFYRDMESLTREHILNSIYFLELLMQYNNTTQFSEYKPMQLPQKKFYQDKITVVLDLDETLVHCYEDESEPHDVTLKVTFPRGATTVAPINIRPHCQQFLKAIAREFEVILFTASHEAYADAVIDYLDPKKELVQHRLYRRHCEYIQEGYYIKDLRLLNRDLSRIVLVDNAAYSYAFQVDNGIPIIPFYSGEDFQLPALQEYLYSLKGHEDVREANRMAFRQTEYCQYTLVEEVVEKLYKDHQ